MTATDLRPGQYLTVWLSKCNAEIRWDDNLNGYVMSVTHDDYAGNLTFERITVNALKKLFKKEFAPNERVYWQSRYTWETPNARLAK